MLSQLPKKMYYKNKCNAAKGNINKTWKIFKKTWLIQTIKTNYKRS